MKQILQLSKFILLAIGLLTSTLWGQVTTFEYTGGIQTYIVPPGVTSVQMDLYGASGYGNLGYGGRVVANLTVTPGTTLNIFVGGTGGPTTGGYNGGGVPGSNATYGGGGGASDVRQGGLALANRIIVAGGGGGSGSNCGTWTAEGGDGGGLIAESDFLYSCSHCQYTGSGGSQVAGGIAGPTGHGSCSGNNNGALGVGGSNTIAGYGTGGGGGYYGGGSGCFEGAGGGSSYTTPSATDVVHFVGVRNGNGQVIITVLCTGLTTSVSGTELCQGDGLTLSASSSTGGSVSWDLGVVDGVTFEPPVGTTTYTASSDSDDDCDFSVEILVHAAPAVTASVDDAEICIGEDVIFTGGGALTYTWSPDVVTDGVAYSPAETGTYTVTGTDANSCTNEAEVTVIVHESPPVTASVDIAEMCDGGSFIFTGGGAVSYDWDMGVTDGDPFTAPIGTATYTVTGTDEFGCENVASIEATVHPNPVVTATASETEVCYGTEVTFNGGGATTYVWDMDIIDDEPTAMLLSGTFTVTVVGTDDNGCENTAGVEMTVAEEIVVTSSTVDEIAGSDGTIDLTVSGGVAPYIIDWDNDGTGDFDDTEDLTGLNAGTYTVVVKDDSGCTTTVTIDVNSQLSIGDNSKNNLLVYPNPTTGIVIVEHAGFFNYEVTDVSGAVLINASGADKVTLSLDNFANGNYFITIKAEGQISTAKIVKN
jgi:hypothetical protein